MLKTSGEGTWLGIRSRLGIRLAGILASILAAWVARAAGTLFGADYVVSDRFETLHVTETICANFAFQVGVKGLVMIMILERLTRHARPIWTVAGWILLIGSYQPILVVDASPSTKIFLAIINTVTALVFMSAVRSNVAVPDGLRRPAVDALLVVAGTVFGIYTMGGLLPVVSFSFAPVVIPVDTYLLPAIALVAIIGLVASSVRSSRREQRGSVPV